MKAVGDTKPRVRETVSTSFNTRSENLIDPGPLEYQDDRRYAKLARKHIAKTGSTTREIWKLMEQEKCDKANIG